jgi:hypothetical protein
MHLIFKARYPRMKHRKRVSILNYLISGSGLFTLEINNRLTEPYNEVRLLLCLLNRMVESISPV